MVTIMETQLHNQDDFVTMKIEGTDTVGALC